MLLLHVIDDLFQKIHHFVTINQLRGNLQKSLLFQQIGEKNNTQTTRNLFPFILLLVIAKRKRFRPSPALVLVGQPFLGTVAGLDTLVGRAVAAQALLPEAAARTSSGR